MKSLSNEWRLQPVVTRLLLCFTLVVILAGGLPAPAQAVGLYGHTWFVESAIQQLAAQGGRYADLVRILNRYPAEVNYGAIFPDITMKVDTDWAEITHDTAALHNPWDGFGDDIYERYLIYLVAKDPKDYKKYDNQLGYYREFLRDPQYGAFVPPFRAALINSIAHHIRATPRTADDEKLIAFVFGVIAHQEADIPWHLNHPHCDQPSFEGIGWGTECAAEAKGLPNTDLGEPELTLDHLLYAYDNPEHTVAFDSIYQVDDLVYEAVDAAGIRRPNRPWHCVNPDPLWCGQEYTKLAWAVSTENHGQDDALRNWLIDYAPGGIKYGAALAAAAWIDTWDRYAPALPTGQLRSLQSHNFPDRYIRHAFWSFRIDPIVGKLDRRDATFRLVAGLADSGCVSIEALNFPGSFLHDTGQAGVPADLAAFQDNPDFRKAATFCARSGLANSNAVSFESLLYPERYLRHSNYQLLIESGQGGTFPADATFLVGPPMTMVEGYLPLLVR